MYPSRMSSVDEHVNHQYCNTEKSFFSFLFFSPVATQPIVGVYFTALCRALASSRTRLLDHKQRRAIVDRTPLNERSVRRSDHRELF